MKVGVARAAAGWVAAALGCAVATAGHAEAPPPDLLSQDLTQFSLEELFAQEVSSLAKRPQNVRDAAAAVFVISREDIRRSGATSLPELLRMAPGMEVAVLSGDGAAVTARGFNSSLANKLLILLDGRLLYASTVAGVPWNSQIIPLESIERVEVVRGPGATLWGANAVNGVINIITKHAIDTAGTLAVAERDDDGSHHLTLGQGLRVGDDGVLRLSARLRDRNAHALVGPLRVEDRADAQAFGFRYDVEPTSVSAITVQGDLTDARTDTQAAGKSRTVSGNLLARWTYTPDAGRRTTLQAYWDESELKLLTGLYAGRTIDVELSGRFQIGPQHDVVYGIEYRRIEATTRRGVASLPPVGEDWIGGYLQDDIRLSDRLKLSAGVKLERHPKTGLEVQPSLRAIWMDPAGWSAWAALSRAVRTPSNLETDATAEAPSLGFLVPGAVDSEVLIAAEAGWRGRIAKGVNVDLAAYHNWYSDLIGARAGLELVGGAPLVVFRPDNVGSAKSYGVEAALDVRVTDRWSLKGALTLQHVDIDAGPLTTLGLLNPTDSRSPSSQFSLRSMMDLRDDLDLDVWVRRVGKLSGGLEPAYTDLDLRLAWRATPNLEFTLKGVNLLREERVEFISPFSPAAIVDRRVAVGFALRR